MQQKNPSYQNRLPNNDTLLLRQYFHSWTVNELIDTILSTIPIHQQKNMLASLKRKPANV